MEQNYYDRYFYNHSVNSFCEKFENDFKLRISNVWECNYYMSFIYMYIEFPSLKYIMKWNGT